MGQLKHNFETQYGPWALVAGASEGLGRAYCLQLAQRGLSIVMVARNEDTLLATAEEVRALGVSVRPIVMDLASADIARELVRRVEDIEIGLLVYNAGISSQHHFLEADVEQHLEQLYVNCRGPVLLAHAFGQAMVARGRGGIILMSSVAGLVGSGLNAMYGATKGFDIVLGEGIARDLESNNVDVLSMIAGATRTPQFERTQVGNARIPVMEPEAVVREALRSLGRTNVRIAGSNKAAATLLSRLLPRRLASKLLTRASYAVRGKGPRLSS